MTTTKQYDYLNRLTAINSAIGSSSIGYSYAYNSANQRTRSTLADGSYWVYTYDSLGQVVSGHKFFADARPCPASSSITASTPSATARDPSRRGPERPQPAAGLLHRDSLNQYTNRDVPGAVDIMGLGLATNTVTVNGKAPYRKGEYFRQQLGVANTAPRLAVCDRHRAGETTISGNLYVPQTPEQFTYDADGNLTNDGRWTYTWDAENRLVAMTTNNPRGPAAGLKFEYDWQGRRIHKQVWSPKAAPPPTT